jgi:antitoxin component of RelBE/YafQ-DinJ toxin-antitoxin module
MADATTDIQNSATTMRLEGFGGFLRPTPAERAAGRFMRAPDHGDDGGADGGDGGDAGGGAADRGADGGADAQGGDAGSGTDGNDADGGSLLSKAGAPTGDGSDGEGGNTDGEGDGKDGKDDASASDGPPETYELAPIKVGEGDDAVEIEIDVALLEAATPVFKEVGLTNDQAQKLVPLAIKVQERLLGQQADDFEALKSDWVKAVHKDKELGGAKWAETETLAAKAMDTFAGPSEMKVIDGKKVETNPFRVVLDNSGLGNHPEFMRVFRRIGEKLGEDKPTETSTTGQKAKPDRVRELYPNDPPKEGAK